MAQRFSNMYGRVNTLFGKWWVNKPIRLVRTVGLGMGLITAGHQLGTLEYARDPIAKEEEMLKTLLQGCGSVRYYQCGSHEPPDNEETAYIVSRVEPCATRVLHAARVVCRERVKLAKAALAKATAAEHAARATSADARKASELVASLPELLNDELDLLSCEDALEEAREACKTVSGNWRVVIFKTEQGAVNAFVSPLCPRTIFVTEGLVSILNPSTDELGLVLAHEVSHLVLRHSRDDIYLHAGLLVMQLVALSLLDPTGLLDIVAIAATGWVSNSLEMCHSRESEREADSLGLEIAASACFNTVLAVEFFAKIAECEDHAHAGWMSTHPSSDQRYAALCEEAALVSRDVGPYKTNCSNVKRHFHEIIHQNDTALKRLSDRLHISHAHHEDPN